MHPALAFVYTASIAIIGALVFAAIAIAIARYIELSVVVLVLLLIIGTAVSLLYTWALQSIGVSSYAYSGLFSVTFVLGAFAAGRTHKKYWD